MKRTLSLRTEHLGELTAGELASVAGASGIPCEITGDLPPTRRCTGYYPSINAPCESQVC